ncbi:MAG: ligand-binding sensor domain-containing protein [Segetibacter sp.]
MRKIVIAFALLLTHPAFSQIKDLHFKRLSVEDGLPENYATCVLQDKRGYIWFGTQNGLVRYDGYKVKVYNLNTPDKKDRSYRSIRSIIEDKQGAIWVGTFREGVFRYNWSTDDFTQFEHGTKDARKPKVDNVSALVEDKEGDIWALSFDNAKKDLHLDRIKPQLGTLETYDSLSKGNHHIPAKIFSAFTKDSTGNIWIGSKNGLFRFDYTTKKFLPFFNASDDKAAITNVFEAPSEPGILWLSVVSNNKQSFVRFDTKNKAVKTYQHQSANPKSLHCDTVLTVFEDKAKRLWLGTTNGLSLFDRKTESFTAYLPQDHLPDSLANRCWDIKEGHNGELWILTGNVLSGSGLFYLPSLQSKLVRYQYDETKPYGLPSNTLNISFVDRNQNLWIGFRNNGFYLLDEKASQFESIQKTSEVDSYPGGGLIASVPIGLKTYLMATLKGLFRYELSTNHYTSIPFNEEKKVQESIQNLIVDKTGIAWLGTRNDGLFRYDSKNNSTTNFKNNPSDSLSLPYDNVRCIYEDKEGNLWVGTRAAACASLID